MAKVRRGGTQCLNCGKALKLSDNYCSECGQINNNPKVSFGQLSFDFLSNYFSLDSKFVRSFVPFLFKPGFLTNRFIEGKRMSYVNPVRHYFIIALIYFFVLSLQVTEFTEKIKTSLYNADEGQSVALLDSMRVNNQIAVGDQNFKAKVDLDDSGFEMSVEEWRLYQSMKAKKLSTNEILDSLKVDEKSFWEQLIIKQFVKIDNSDISSVGSFVVKNASYMMFFLLPFYALILKMAYRKQKDIYYIEHLIHSLHIHAFVFLVFAISQLLNYFDLIDLSDWVLWLITIYIYFSLKAVYKQSYLKTFIKVLLIGAFYSFVFAIAIMLEIIISLLIF